MNRDYLIPALMAGDRTTMRKVILAVADASGVTIDEILGPRRRREIAWARQYAMFLCREMGLGSYPIIGDAFERDHSTVQHAVKAVNKRMTPDIRAGLDQIKAEVTSPVWPIREVSG